MPDKWHSPFSVLPQDGQRVSIRTVYGDEYSGVYYKQGYPAPFYKYRTGAYRIENVKEWKEDDDERDSV